ncbi:MAG TPA: Ldh family oxidoreductase [Cyclobacteriaceae bacterium]|nr:Ldh family oxidoreductase [Cyclobacteriaceae bacterium]
MKTFSPSYLKEFTEQVFVHFNVPKDHAQIAAGILALSDIRGIDSHGVARLHSYAGLLSEGRINPNPKIGIVREKKSVCTVDGDNGLGLVVGHYANLIAIEKAKAFGSGWVSVSNTNHFGIAGYYVLEALKHDMIGWAMTNSTKLVAPLWGAERMLGTNPIAIAFPGLKEPPVVIDLATSAAAFGKIEIAMRSESDIPEGWIINKDGITTTQPKDMIDGGALLPLGSTREAGGHKGYALASMVDILTAVLSGANWGPFAPPFALRQEIPERSVGKGIGHFFGAMEIDGFMEVNEFKERIDEWVSVMRNTRPVKGKRVVIPGDPEREQEKIRSTNGIPLSDKVVDDLRAISKMTGVPFEAD